MSSPRRAQRIRDQRFGRSVLRRKTGECGDNKARKCGVRPSQWPCGNSFDRAVRRRAGYTVRHWGIAPTTTPLARDPDGLLGHGGCKVHHASRIMDHDANVATKKSSLDRSGKFFQHPSLLSRSESPYDSPTHVFFFFSFECRPGNMIAPVNIGRLAEGVGSVVCTCGVSPTASLQQYSYSSFRKRFRSSRERNPRVLAFGSGRARAGQASSVPAFPGRAPQGAAFRCPPTCRPVLVSLQHSSCHE